MFMDLIPFFLAGLLIFAFRVIDVALYSMRLLMVLQRRKLLAWVFGFFQAAVYISVVRSVILNIGEWNRVVGYAAGFATGVVVGMLIESRIALGYTRLRIISPSLGDRIAETLRESGYGLTEIPAQGLDGMVTQINCTVPRRQTTRVLEIVEGADPEAFITAESVRALQRGFWPK